eukprot:gnl/TRDRNA2_/TRDRNA2_177696_c1_seq3.p1 gnl/TRDRNA2_/TRDRNA2_177696_c1~~gnl/TRDRNA2_/TRDRNA2_177696_c1_seq3.p1  ORF type:complete len:619 (+),score=179.75 gnl/TRDRNA2_/TRDRNA2_177696_c1_seq3:114-1859(+)
MATKVLEVSKHSSRLVPSDDELETLHMLSEAGADGQAPAFEFHSNDIIATLESLHKSFKMNNMDLTELESHAREAYEKKKQALLSEKEITEKEKDEKMALEQSKSEDLAAAREFESSSTTGKNSDETFLGEVKEQCNTKAEEYDQRSKSRADELQAIATTITTLEEEVQHRYDRLPKLNDGEFLQRSQLPTGEWHIKPWVPDPSRGHDSELPLAGRKSFLQSSMPDRRHAQKKPESFIQLRGSSKSSSSVPRRMIEMLQSAALRLKSPQLSVLALKAQVSADHFVKVRGLIKDLIAKLKEDAENEQDQKGMCDKSMAEAIDSRDQAMMTREEKAAEISKNEAEKDQLTEDTDNLHEAIAANMKALKEATELRDEDFETNYDQWLTASKGAHSVNFAISTMADFYGGRTFEVHNPDEFTQLSYAPFDEKAGVGSDFDDLPPATGYSGEYHGNKDGAKGIQGMLEVILFDMVKNANAAVDYDQASKEKYDTIKAETDRDTESKEAAIKDKEVRIAEISDSLATLQDDKQDAEENLKDSLAELEKLKPMCVDGEETYEERKAKREQEVAALKEAMQMLIDWQNF